MLLVQLILEFPNALLSYNPEQSPIFNDNNRDVHIRRSAAIKLYILLNVKQTQMSCFEPLFLFALLHDFFLFSYEAGADEFLVRFR